jgi:hypothetical protein
MVDEMYWEYRVQLTEDQAVLGFPKFGTIGIGFAREDDWNANLPFACPATKILDHIWHNAGDPAITRGTVFDAIELIQAAARRDHPEMVQSLEDD